MEQSGRAVGVAEPVSGMNVEAEYGATVTGTLFDKYGTTVTGTFGRTIEA